jgi:hypothetical protein
MSYIIEGRGITRLNDQCMSRMRLVALDVTERNLADRPKRRQLIVASTLFD